MTNPIVTPATQANDSAKMPQCLSVPKTIRDSYDGTLVGLTGDELVMSTEDNQQHTFTIAKDAYVCCDGVTCTTADLETGSKIRLTAHVDHNNVATIIESLSNQIDFADHR